MEPGGEVLTLRSGLAAGLIAQAALLAALATTVGVTAVGWLVGLASGAAIHVAVARVQARGGVEALGPADLVTLTRATVACGAAALVADSFVRQPAVTTLVALAVVALVLDAVDGWVARHTRTTSVFGARFDGEVDAFLILVLSGYVASSAGWWVLAIGAARYVFAAAGLALPWMRRTLPPRYWRKVVAAAQGVVLTVAAADVASAFVTYAALVVALALLSESFGRDVWWLWCRRSARSTRRSTVTAASADVLALLIVWFALVVPDQAWTLTPGAFLRIPVEGLVVAGLALVLPPRGRRAVAVAVGVLLALLTLVKAANMGFFAALDRPFNVVTDREYFSPIRILVRDAIGPVAGDAVLTAMIVLTAALLVLMPLSLGRLTELVARHRSRSVPTVMALALLWVACAATGLHVHTGVPVASTSAARLTVDQVSAITAAVGDQQRFDAAAAVDRYDDAGGADLLAGLRGQDVLIAFVESYGRVAVEGPRSSPQVRAVLDTGTRRLAASGYSSRSAFLTSPTFGGLSWLAHSTLQTGLWVSDQGRYHWLLSSDRMSLSRLFGRAGWRTVAVMPSNRSGWPEGQRFYRFDKIYDAENIDYSGPSFGFSRMPDQYALAAFQEKELAEPDRVPVMAQIELASSHAPWAPTPEMVDWDRLGDGSLFDRMHDLGESATELWSRGGVEAAYAESINYSLRTLISFVDEYGDDDLVLVILGDHQPATVVSGHGASRDVPVTVIAHDPAVLDRISGWGWQQGLRPDAQAPVWRMDTFRDRFLAAYGADSARAP